MLEERKRRRACEPEIVHRYLGDAHAARLWGNLES